MLVGINLLRGVGYAAVSLGHPDADKEGFCEAIGRDSNHWSCARNLNGRAILYADNMTGSMERAINGRSGVVTKLAFNEENGVVPKGIEKSVRDILEGARRMPTARCA